MARNNHQNYPKLFTSIVLITVCLFCKSQTSVSYLDSLLLEQGRLERKRDYQSNNHYLNLLIQISEQLTLSHKDSLSNIYVRNLDSLSRKNGYQYGLINAHRLRGILFRHQSSHANAMTELKMAKELSRKVGLPMEENKADLEMGIIYYNIDQYDSAEVYYERVLHQASRLDQFQLKVFALVHYGHLKRRNGNYDQALDFYEEAHLLTLEHRNVIANPQRRLGVIAHSLGIVHQNRGNLSLALDSYYERLHISQQLGDSAGICQVLGSIAVIANRQEKYEDAASLYKQALAIARVTGQKKLFALYLNNLAGTYTLLNDDKAFVYLQLALEASMDIDSQSDIASVNSNIGKFYLKKGNFNQAITYFRRADSLASKIDYKAVVGAAKLGMATAFMDMGKIDKAKPIAKEALLVAQELNSNRGFRRSHELLSKIYEREGSIDQALKHYKLYKNYSDTIFNLEVERETTLLEAQYEYDKKEAWLLAEQRERESRFTQKLEKQQWALIIILVVLVSVSSNLVMASRGQKRLKAINSELFNSRNDLRNQSIKLEKLNAMKDKLFSIIGHDLKKPLQNLSGLLFSGLRSNLSREEFDILISQLGRSVSSTADTMENLLEWSRSQLEGFKNQPEHVTIKDVVSKVVDLLITEANRKGVLMTLNIPTNHVAWADPNQIELIVRNLVSNALKFTSTNGMIRISSEYVGDKLVITVSDTGQGISEDKIQKLMNGSFQTPMLGTDGEQGSGIGLMLCKEMVFQNQGEIWIKSSIDHGSSFSFSIPIKNVASNTA